MATRWMKWNEGTHIFEYSTDGVTFNPLPLDASILSQGTIDPARLPPGTLTGGGNNVFTGINTLSSVAPTLRFNETDAPTDVKNWELVADAQLFKIRSNNDAWSAPVDLLTVTRIGTLVVNQAAAGSNNFICAAAGSIGLSVRSTNPGAGSYAQLLLGNDASVFASVFQMFSSGYTGSPEPDFAGGLSVKAGQVGGISIVAQHASGGIRFYTGGVNTKRLEITAAGNAVFSGAISEYGRAVAQGVWTTVPFAAGDYTASSGTWTVEAADVSTFRYMVIGKTLFYNIRLLATTTSAGMGTQIKIKMPGGFSSTFFGMGIVHYNMNGTYETGLVTAQGADIILFRLNFNNNFVSSLTNTFDVRVQGFVEIA